MPKTSIPERALELLRAGAIRSVPDSRVRVVRSQSDPTESYLVVLSESEKLARCWRLSDGEPCPAQRFGGGGVCKHIVGALAHEQEDENSEDWAAFLEHERVAEAQRRARRAEQLDRESGIVDEYEVDDDAPEERR